MNSNSNNQSISNESTEDKERSPNQAPNQISPNPKPTTTKDSFVKLAMRNMVKKGSTSLFHFFLTIVGVIGALLGLAIAFH
jgi:hypothetical protein